jgi:Zn-dependent protease with chaperone function
VDEQEWDALVRRLEREAREDPSGYKSGVVRFAALGYAYIGFALLVLLALAGIVIWLVIHHPGPLVKFLIPIAAVTWIVVRSLIIRIDPPDALPLTSTDAPEFFRELAETNRAVQGPRLDAVFVDWQLNASVEQHPRAGGLLGSRNYLVVGLPLLQALSPDEFRAVLAHELAHLSRAHGRFGTRIYRIRATWEQLLAALEERKSWGTVLFRRFFEWYVPRFVARTFPLMRMHELEADRLAADAAGAKNLAHALGRLAVADRYLETTYWPNLYGRASEERDPPYTAFAPLAAELLRTPPEARSWLQELLEQEADTADTHPAFAARLAALRVDPESLRSLNGSRTESAAERFLGSIETTFAEQLDAHWRAGIAETWRAEHERARDARRRLTELAGRDANSLSDDELIELAGLSAEFESPDDALRRAQAVLDRQPENEAALLAVGLHLLEQGDDAGLEHLERVMAADPTMVLTACEIAAGYLSQRGRDAEANRYRQRAQRHAELLAAAGAEREDVSDEDELEPANLPDAVVEKLRATFARHDDIGRAYVVRKRVEQLGDELPLYVVGVVPKHEWRQLWKEADDDKPSLAQVLIDEIELPGDFHLVVPGPRNPMKKRLASVPGAEIFRRD